MNKEELNKKLDRLDEIINEAKERINEARDIINNLESIRRDVLSSEYDNIPLTVVQLKTKSNTTRFYNVCTRRLKIQSIGDLLRITPRELGYYSTIGATCIKEVQEFLKETYGIDWV